MNIDDMLNGITETMDSHGETDNIMLHDMFGLISSVASFVLGLLLVGILILIPLIVSVEIMYINFVVIREPIDKLAESNGKIGETVGFICRDARRAVKESILSEGKVNSNRRYLAIKIKSTMVIIFAVAIIVQGTSMFITKSYGLMSGFIDVIENLL